MAPRTAEPAFDISAAEARRIAIAAQGLAAPRPRGRITTRHVGKVFAQLGVVQIDSVNVLARSHELVLFARLGPYDRGLFDAATKAGLIYEYWVHQASHVSMDHFHLHRWKWSHDHQWSGINALQERRPGYVDDVLARVEATGPVVSGEFGSRVGPKGTWWDWDDAKIALEHLFWTGRVTARRRPDFARQYDLMERWIPQEVLERPLLSEEDSRKELLVLAAQHLGVGTYEDLQDYHRLKRARTQHLVPELVEDGRLVPVMVEGWKKPAYLHPQAQRPRRVSARALLSPFDSMIWNRDRTRRLFGFDVTLEIYVPQAKRKFGYYVLPFLLDDEIVGQVDLKADRAARTLLVQASYAEPGVPDEVIVEPLMAELRLMADWLGLATVAVQPRGDLAASLAAAAR